MEIVQRLLHTLFYLTVAGYAMLALFLIVGALADGWISTDMLSLIMGCIERPRLLRTTPQIPAPRTPLLRLQRLTTTPGVILQLHQWPRVVERGDQKL